MADALLAQLAALIDYGLLADWWQRLLAGVATTLEVVVISCGLGFVLAYPICVARRSSHWLWSKLALGYVTFFRGTPLLCQLYLVYYGAGEIRPFLTDIGIWWFFREAFYCSIFAFTLNTAAYQAEIMRGALASVPKGQIEAARSLGLSAFRINRHVIWPQALLIALRPFGNEFISIIKASALTAIVTLQDLMGVTRIAFSRTFDFTIYLYCAIIFLIMTELVRRVWNRIERALSKHLLFTRAAAAAAEAESVGPGRVPLTATQGAVEPH